jgi:membrane protease YdiL (CAAX protease family)
VSGRLYAWLAIPTVLAALNYGARASTGTPDNDALYKFGTAVAGLVQYGLIFGAVMAISGGSRDLLGLQRPRSWKWALAGAFCVIVFVFVVGGIVDQYFNPGKEQGLAPTRWESSHAAAFAANFIVVALVAPLVEELTFRGLGFGLLRRYGQVFAVVAVGILFGLAHGLVEGLLVLVPFGMALAWLRARTESIYPCIAVHVFFNSIVLILGVTT